MSNELINEFLDKKSLEALDVLLSADDIAKVKESGVLVSKAFNASDDAFTLIADARDSAEDKLISSFNNNLVLLIQKTWVEKSDEELKAQVLYHLQEFEKLMQDKSYVASYKSFLEIVDTVVYLMFGSQTKTKDFDEYALRIDPEFGIFWWYIKSLPTDVSWSEDKTRIAILLGMYFLANY
ncbi:MAG: hypothetical protein IKI90_00635 [Treponema sp.]|nr:hypothetical protein [Treponema sp.]MBR4004335.1 hypothetical protein [Treponema sp.]